MGKVITAKCNWEFVQYSDGSVDIFELKKMTPEMKVEVKKYVDRFYNK